MCGFPGEPGNCRTLTLLSELPKVGKHRVRGWGGWWHLVIPTSSCVQFPCCFTNELLEVEGDTGQGLLLTHGPVRPAQANVLPHHPKSHPPCPRALVLVPPKSLPSLLRPPVLNSHLYRFQ